MLEAENMLWTWRIYVPPERILQDRFVAAERIADHSLRFLDYEGPVQKGTGTVQIAEQGYYTLTHRQPDHLKGNFVGEILKGSFTLLKKNDPQWILSIS